MLVWLPFKTIMINYHIILIEMMHFSQLKKSNYLVP